MSESGGPQNNVVRLLRWSEQYFKTDMVYLAQGGFWLTLGTVSASIASLVLAVAFANLLHPETYGVYKFVLSIVAILTLATLPGIDTAYVRAVARGKENIFLPLLTEMRWGVLGAVASLTFAGYYFFQGNNMLALAFVVTAVFIPVMDPLALYDQLFSGRRAFSTSTKLGLIARLATTLVIIGTLFFWPTLIAVLLAYLAGWTIIRGIFFWYSVKAYKPNQERDESIPTYGKHLTFMKGAGTIAGSLGSILLFHVGGGSALAIYTLALAPVEQLRGLLGFIEPLIFPKLAHDNWRVSSFSAFMRKTAGFFVVLGSGIAFYIVAAPFLFSLVFPKYAASIIYSQVLAPTLLLSASTLLLSIILRAKGETRKLYISSIVSIIATLAFTPLATYLLGIWGLIGSIFALKTVETLTLIYLTFRSAPFTENKNQSSEEENGTSE